MEEVRNAQGYKEVTPRNVHEELEDLLDDDIQQNGPQTASKGEGENNQNEAKKKKKKNKKKNKGGQQQNAQQQQNYQSNNAPSYRSGKRIDLPTTPLKYTLGSSFYDDTDSSEDEGLPDYKIGGYHPMHVGEILVNRYVIIQKLGWGHFSTVWLAKDIIYNTYVALKIQRSAPHYLEAAFDEVEILDQASSYWMKPEWLNSLKKYYSSNPDKLKSITSNDCYSVQLLNCLLHHGPHGKHFVMVFEILGVNLLEVIKRYNYKGVPFPLVRIMAKQMLMGLDYLHRVCKIIHTDLKPENVNLCLRDEEVQQIAEKGSLSSNKMYGQTSSKNAIPSLTEPLKSTRVNRHQDNEGSAQPSTSLDKQAKRAAKRKEQKKRRKARQQAQKEASQAAKQKEEDFDREQSPEPRESFKKSLTFARQNDSASKGETFASRQSESAKKPIQAGEFNLKEMTPRQIQCLNEVLNEHVEMPRCSSEPKRKQAVSPDLRPEAIESMDPMSKQHLLQQLQMNQIESLKHDWIYDVSEYQTNKMKHDEFMFYRKKFEQAQRVLSTKDEYTDREKELAKDMGLSHFNLDNLDPRKMQQQIEEDKAKRRGPKLTEELRLKVCDLGNGCWTYHHFSTKIQTRQYRSPEVIIGAKYGSSADMWSFACMIFEMATGDFLFEPRKGKTYGKDDDHIAQMMELLGRMPDYMALGGIKSRRFFDRTGHLRRIRGLNLWPLKKVLMEKYKYEPSEALAFTEFLLPMLRWDPDKRASAQEMLNHPWLRMEANYDIRLSKEQFNAAMEKQKLEKDLNQELDDPYKNEEMTKLTDSECEIFPADLEDNDDFLRDLSDDESPYFSGPEDKQSKAIRDLANGKNLNNSFGAITPDDWGHLHVDKGANPQFTIFNQAFKEDMKQR